MDTTMQTATTATLRDNGTGEVILGDRVEAITEHTLEKARAKAIALIIGYAAEIEHAVTVISHDPSGTAHLVVTPEGDVHENARASAAAEPAPRVDPVTAADAASTAFDPTPIATATATGEQEIVSIPTVPVNAAPAVAETPVVETPVAFNAPPTHAPAAPQASAPAAPAAPAPATPAPVRPVTTTERTSAPRRSFITEETKAQRAEKGFRGALAKMGLPIGPSAFEAAERADLAAVSRHWTGPRTIAIVNGKGGASKTPTTAMLSAVFARNGGSGVLAWDNNETRGTLGWRTEQGAHEATVQALLPNAAHLMSAGAQSSDLAAYLHHQVADKYDVLRSNPNILAEDQRLTMGEFDAIHAVAAKYFRLIFIDSGNDESADRWRRMIDRADQIVIATTARGEHAEAGALLLEALRDRDEHSASLAKDAVVVVSQADHKGGTAHAEHVAEGFRQMARGASVIPFDPAMRAGKLTFDSLRPETQRAWLAAAAAVAQGL